MRQKIFTLFFAVVASLGTISAEIIERVQIGQLYYNLNSVKLSAEVTYKSRSEDYTYNENWNISSADIPSTVTYNNQTYTVISIGSCAFNNCKNLTSVTIPNSVTIVASTAFSGCKNLPIENNIRYADTYLIEVVDKTLSSYTIKTNTRWLGQNAFFGCKELISITIPNNVTSIGNYAFYNCSSLTSITIPNNVTSIGIAAFSGCSSLTAITIPNGITSIDTYTFSGCSSLTSMNIPNSVTSIGDRAFHHCSGLTSVIIGDGVKTIAEAAFADCSSLTSITIGSGVQTIGDRTGVSMTGYATFANDSNLTEVHISDLTAWCGIDFGSIDANNPLYYAHRLYLNDKEITNLVIPEGVTTINGYVFINCLSITSLYLPNSITTIIGSFDGCTNLKLIYSSSATPPTIGYYTFKNISSDAVVYVPDEYVATYKKAQYWKNMNIQGSSSMPQAIDQVSNNQSPMTNKVIKDGQIFILRGDKTYTLQGQEVK